MLHDGNAARQMETQAKEQFGRDGTRESLASIAKRLKARAKASAQAEYENAKEIVALSESWDETRKRESGGLDFAMWLARNVSPTKRLSHYVTLAEARKKLGTNAERMEPRAAVWLARATGEAKPDETTRAKLQKALTRQGQAPLTLAQVRGLCPDLVARGSNRPRVSEVEVLREKAQAQAKRIERLEEQVRRLGEEPVE